MKLDRLRAIGKTDKVLLEWKPVQRSAKNGECTTLSSKRKNPSSSVYCNAQTAK